MKKGIIAVFVLGTAALGTVFLVSRKAKAEEEEEEEEEVQLPFDFGKPWVRPFQCTVATAWWSYDFGCSITNPHDVALTHTIKFIEHSYSLYHQTWADPVVRHTFQLTLTPGQTYNYTFPKTDECDPACAKPRRYFLYLEDELGNQSDSAFFERS